MGRTPDEWAAAHAAERQARYHLAEERDELRAEVERLTTANRGAVSRIAELEQALDRAAGDLRALGHYELADQAFAPLDLPGGR